MFAGYAAYLRLFTYFGVWDDEGYLLISLRSFLRGEALYDDIYSQYGPFYYLVMGGGFKALGLAVTHDNGRLVSLALWVAASLVCGLILYALTRNLWLACCIQLLALKSSLFNMGFEPMHPGGLLCLLLACLAATPLLLPARPRLALALQGALGAALLLVKINVGVFALLALFVACALTFPRLARHRLLVGLAVAAFVAAPAALLAPSLDELWGQRYAIHITAGALTVAIALLRQGAAERLGTTGIGWLAGSAAVTALLICGAILLGGTSLTALVDGILIHPLNQANAFKIPLELPPHSRKIALLALAAFGLAASPWLGPWFGKTRGDLRLFIGGLLRLAVGGAIAATVSGLFLQGPHGFLLAPWIWVAAMKPHGVEDPEPYGFIRRFLPPLAVLQTLHAYPVAGSQIQWGAYLLVLVAGICLADGARQLFAAAGPWSFWGPWDRKDLRLAGWLLARAAALLLAVLVVRATLLPLRHEQNLMRITAPSPLPGSSRFHLPDPNAEQLVWVTRELEANCSSFVSLPGLNSFYFWARQEPPTSLNATAWMFLFDAPTQERIVKRIRSAERLCLLRQEGLAQGWQRGRPLPDGPLVDYLSRNFVPLESRGGYEILIHAPRRPPA
jgi:hypothetical protein